MLKVVGASWSQIRMSTWIIGVVIVLGIIAIILSETGRGFEDGNYSATAYYSKESGFTVEYWGQGNPLKDIPLGIARAHYDPHMKETGWAIFQVETQASYKDEHQAYAAGLLEGSLTWQIIYYHWYNSIYSFCLNKKSLCDDIRHFLKLNDAWVREAMENLRYDPYWYQVSLFYSQLEGIEDGFNKGAVSSRFSVEEIPSVDFVWLNMMSDVADLQRKFATGEFNKWRKIRRSDQTYPKSKVSKENLEKPNSKKVMSYDCGYEELPLASSFVKFVPEQKNLFFAHNSAGSYSRMIKMFKKYELRYHLTDSDGAEMVPGSRISFSSYPGSIHSMDDYYIIANPHGHNIVTSSTPIPLFNTQLWQTVKPRGTVLQGPRTMVANRMASSIADWAILFSKNNSGTGNKQWLIADMQLFEQVMGQSTQPEANHRKELKELYNLFWVLEQIPGSIVAADQTQVLIDRSYWAGYGIPYYQNISVESGFKRMETEHGSAFSYNQTALANIFRRDQKNASSFQDVMRLMRSNLYKVDPLSEGNPRCAVGSRGDVKVGNADPEPVGVTDVKVLKNNPLITETIHVRNSTVRMLALNPRLQIASGPAFSDNATPEDEDDVQPFSWSNSTFHNISHLGQPDVWMFSPLGIDFI